MVEALENWTIYLNAIQIPNIFVSQKDMRHSIVNVASLKHFLHIPIQKNKHFVSQGPLSDLNKFGPAFHVERRISTLIVKQHGFIW